MRLFLTSDWHADASTSGFDRFDEIAAAARAAADDAARFKREGGDPLFVFSGDLCDPDTTRAFRAVSLAIDLALGLSARGVPSLWIAGNHDVIENDRGATVLEPLAKVAWKGGYDGRAEIRVAEEPLQWSFKTTGVQVVALPYVARARAYEPDLYVDNCVPPDRATEALGWHVRRVVVIGHLTVPGAERGSESLDFARGRDLVFPVEACRRRWGDRVTMINGHYHRRQTPTSDGVYIPGSLARLRHDEETHEPGYLTIDV
jgi:DNA repair exonuclease SbcCD nuclease subunit